MQKQIRKIFLVLFVVLNIFVSIKVCLFIAEKYFFDKFFYKKSAEYGYYVPNTKSKSMADRNKDLGLLLNPEDKVLGANSEVYKIAIIGDSYVLGYGIKNENRFAKIIESKLNKIKPTKVISLSETSTSPVNFLDWYKKLKNITDIDLYIFTLVDNDSYIRPNFDMTPFDPDEIVKKCQDEHPTFTPVFDSSLSFFYQGIDRDDAKSNQIADEEYYLSWSNPINLCALDTSLSQLPSDKSIYFIPDNYEESNDKYKKYLDYLNKHNKNIISSTLGKELAYYKKYWDNPTKNFTVSNMEKHPNSLANKMYADILYNEIISDNKYGFNKK